jgi:NAD(P)-dependent dehydrogenase (short-subunit alcohol dehydrogenase family)
VRPGIVETDMTSGVKEKYDRLIAEGLVPQKRWGYPADTGKVVSSIMNGSMDFSPGSVIHTDGGLHIARL